MANYKMGQRQHYAQPDAPRMNRSARRALEDEGGDPNALPYWMGHYGGENVPMSIPTEEKENFQLRDKSRALQVSLLPNLEMDGKLTGNYNVPPDVYSILFPAQTIYI